MRLSELPQRVPACVERVEDLLPGDRLAARLRLLGFVAGEAVRLVGRGPFGGDPLLVEIGGSRFALRRNEASRVHVRMGPEAAA